MAASTKATGLIPVRMEEADLFIRMETYTMANGKTIKRMEMEYTTIRMAHDMRVNG